MKLIIEIDEKDFHRICQEYISFSDTLEGRGLSAIAEGTPKAIEQEPTENPMCDRNICISNEYNGIGCDECIVNKVEQSENKGDYAEFVEPFLADMRGDTE